MKELTEKEGRNNWRNRTIAALAGLGLSVSTLVGVTGCAENKVEAVPAPEPSASAPLTPGPSEAPTPSPAETTEAPKPPTEALREWKNLDTLREAQKDWEKLSDDKRVAVVEQFLRENYPAYNPSEEDSRDNSKIEETIVDVVIGTKLNAATKLYLDPVLNAKDGEGRRLADMVLDGICSPRGTAKSKIIEELNLDQESIEQNLNYPNKTNELDMVVKYSTKWWPRKSPDGGSFSGIAFTWLKENDSNDKRFPIPVGVASNSMEVLADARYQGAPVRIVTYYPGASETITFDQDEGPVQIDTLPEIDKYDEYKAQRDKNKK